MSDEINTNETHTTGSTDPDFFESLPSDLRSLATIDPVDGDRVATSWTDSPASKALLASVAGTTTIDSSDVGATDVGNAAPQRPRRVIGGVAAALVAAIAAAVVIGVAPWGSSPAYAIRQLPDGVVVVDWNPELRNGDAIAKDLRSFGIDVDVVTVPVSPSAVGKAVSTELPGREPGPVEGITWGADGSDDVFTWRIDPAVFRGPVRIELGVEAKPGEAYTVTGEVFEPGEVLGGLQCALGEPLRAEQLVPYLKKLNLKAQWDVVSPVPGRTDSYREDRSTRVPDGEVLWGYAVDSQTVRFSVRPDGVDLSGIDGIEPRLSDVPCTPEQASRW